MVALPVPIRAETVTVFRPPTAGETIETWELCEFSVAVPVMLETDGVAALPNLSLTLNTQLKGAADTAVAGQVRLDVKIDGAAAVTVTEAVVESNEPRKEKVTDDTPAEFTTNVTTYCPACVEGATTPSTLGDAAPTFTGGCALAVNPAATDVAVELNPTLLPAASRATRLQVKATPAVAVEVQVKLLVTEEALAGSIMMLVGVKPVFAGISLPATNTLMDALPAIEGSTENWNNPVATNDAEATFKILEL